MVMNDKEYTKHYFIEGERVCTKVGGGFRYAPTDPDAVQLQFMGTSTATSVSDDLWTMTIRGVDCSGYPSARVSVKPKLRPARNDASRAESQQYFYHPDHLGSSSFVTDAAGLVEQHMQYLPYGELFVNQQNSTYDTRYKFSAKELDNETGYNYFGARYYDSDLSVWLSVDPLSDKYPESSPYMYVLGNPVKLIDPNGMSAVGPDDYFDVETGEYLGSDKQYGVKTDDVRTITKEQWNNITNNKNTTDRQKALALHHTGKQLSTKNPLSAETETGIANHYYEEAGYDLNKLEGKSITPSDGNYYSTNSRGELVPERAGMAYCDINDLGELIIAVDITSYGVENTIVNKWDFISIFQHERGMHGRDWLAGIPYNKNTKYAWEQRAYNYQINTNWATFQKTSPNFKEHIIKSAESYGIYLKNR
jgi:RHS repeat-associated protein